MFLKSRLLFVIVLVWRALNVSRGDKIIRDFKQNLWAQNSDHNREDSGAFTFQTLDETKSVLLAQAVPLHEFENTENTASVNIFINKTNLGGEDGDDDGSSSPIDRSSSVNNNIEVIESVPLEEDKGVDAQTDIEEKSRLQLKAIWRNFITKPLSTEELNTFLQRNFSTDNALQDSILSKPNINFNVSILYKTILEQFLDPLSSKSGAQWLDRDFVLSLRGLAVFAHNPDLQRHSSSRSLSSSSQRNHQHLPGIKLTCPLGTLSIQRSVVKALAQSLQSYLVTLDKNTLLSIREQGLTKDIPRHLLSRSHMFSALLDIIEDDPEQRYVLVLGDKTMTSAAATNIPWLLASPSAAETVLDELKLPTSRIFFIMTTPDIPLSDGSTSIPPVPSSSFSASQSQSQSQSPLSQSMLQSQLQAQGIMPPNGFPPLPSGKFPTSMFPTSGMHTARGFHVIMQNGTASMVPMNENGPMMPPMQIDMDGDDLTSPEEIPMKMAKLFAEKQKQMAAEVNEDELQDLMADPEANMEKISQMLSQKFLSQLPLSQIFQNMPPGMLPTDLRNGSTVEVNIHLVPLPPGMHPGMLSGSGSIPGTSPGQGPHHGMGLPGLPGTFFRGMDLRGRDKDSSSTSTTTTPPPSPSPPPLPPGGTPPSSSETSGIDGKNSKDNGSGSTMTAAGSILSLLEEIEISPPADHNLREKWDKIVSSEIARRIYKNNRRLLLEELNLSDMTVTGGTNRALSSVSMVSLLGKQMLNRDDIHKAVTVAMKLQLGRDGGRVRTEATGVEEDTIDNSRSIEVEDVDVEEEPKLKFEISIWSLESGLCRVIKPEFTQRVTLSRLARPRSLTREEVSSLAQDKHERALVSNIILPQDIGVTYAMIGGLDHVKQLLRQCVTYPLKYPGLYSEGIASEAVKGVLLFGPPGTGKTMLAKAVATEGGATFLAIDASSIENKWLGESEKNAKAVFTLARRLAPCVIYLDEVDSVLSSRERGDDSSHGTLTSVKTTLMQEWDGLRTSQDRVMVIASTNRPFDLDEAVLRRLPRRIMVDLPDTATRTEILSVSLANNRIAPDVNLTRLAESLEGYSGSDIKEVCREAVVRVSHERADLLELGQGSTIDSNAVLRAVNTTDFRESMRKLKASVDENGRELQKVIEWNEKYGEMKRTNSNKKRTPSLSMYI